MPSPPHAPGAVARHGIVLETEHLEVAFPFHLAVDRDLNILQAGRSLLKLCPRLPPGNPWTKRSPWSAPPYP
jgi:hypothetical protein